MERITKYKGLALLVLNILMILGCANVNNSNNEISLSNIIASEQENKISEEVKEEYGFWGVWKIDEVALTSEMYTGTIKDGELQENLYDPEDYVGKEVEYLSDSFRLGNHIYNSPKYIIKYVSVEEFQNGGDFRLPDLYGLIEEKHIKVDMLDKYDNLSETLLLRFDILFADDVQYDIYPFIPIGTQCVILNNDTMLIGIWGKVLLAHKV